uniref:Mitochondrial proton/calcium exchanger protein n=1 Tax=Chlamydomonas leiostraca TaxID=1034604 RepID=A0A7S0S1J7_9CHLO|mmetsp:Transcript_37575/g.94860  ORF Transcript_37575/g.94860 Transcript_37575/m.94860 type:complete len:929 (+) Transcript_37575:91-2877(+)|eukprot:CAMPEP_0202864544 /NCGR_PEP_ID=MMETSP1391-20130828/4742_1 /ASSEMBLY_ACC=CAM_ASM_000867 /TAXON_ID=1034604 /ORGANISM="Chlamydomonas leiostraca, Strain SAG 11-49" /LENGTH=928 /DNA_ID=CAMNT_0049544299 /DNA_START=88 /DNA_END=2874 /DNA_ORIENTATION=+
MRRRAVPLLRELQLRPVIEREWPATIALASKSFTQPSQSPNNWGLIAKLQDDEQRKAKADAFAIGLVPAFSSSKHELVFTRLILESPFSQHQKRSISFFRFLSGGKPLNKRLGLPDAADADAAIQDYEELRKRLDTVQRPSSIKSAGQVALDVAVSVKNGMVTVAGFLGSVPRRYAAWRAMTPEEWKKWKAETWVTVKHEAHHYWVGSKLLALEVRIASRHAWKAARGQTLSRRERAQLTRTTADLFRLVPMVIIIVIPFLEFLLPVLLKIFPNMLPSTFEDKLKKEEELKRRLALRLELARFLQDTVAVMATDIAKRKQGTSDTDAAALHDFIKKVRAGEPVENAEIIRFARLFNDELTLDNLERLQLVGMCQFVGISSLGSEPFLRSRLRAHLSQIKADDYEIENEGLENLTDDELRQACRARGIRAVYGEGAVRYMQRQMRDWLDLSLHRGLPSSLLLLSRAFTITAKQPSMVLEPTEKSEAAYSSLKETMGTVIPEEVVETVAAEVGGPSQDSVKALQQKLDFLRREEEAIRAELQRAEAAARAAAAAEAAVKVAQTATAQAFKEAVAMGSDAAAAAAAAASDAQAAKAVASESAAGAAAAAAASKPADVPVSAEEAAEAATEAREARIRQIVSSLMDLATGSGVTKERKLFMDLMRNEINRVNAVLATAPKASSTGSMAFSKQGLEVNKDTVAGADPSAAPAVHAAAAAHAVPGVPGAAAAHAHGGEPGTPAAAKAAAEQEEEAAVAAALPSRLSDRVSRMLTSIEKELDQAELKIGSRLHMLDTDQDGLISPDELANAVGFLREQLSPQEMQELLAKLTAASAASLQDASSVSGSAGGAAGPTPADLVAAVKLSAQGPTAAAASSAAAAAVAAVGSSAATNIQVAELITLAAKGGASSGGSAEGAAAEGSPGSGSSSSGGSR